MLGKLVSRFGTAIISTTARLSVRTWSDMMRPPSPVAVVRASGLTPDRVLLTGGSSAVGFGTITHEVALAGCLARQTSALTGRGLDMDVNAYAELTVARVLASISAESIARYDAIVLTVGTREAYEFMPLRLWRSRLSALLDLVAAAPGCTTEVIVVGAEAEIPVMLPAFIAAPGRARALRMNEASREIVAARQRVTFVESPMAPGRSDDDSMVGLSAQALYATTASALAPVLAAALERGSRGSAPPDEEARSAAVRRIAGPGVIDQVELDLLVKLAKDLIGSRGATLDIVEDDVIRSCAASGVPGIVWPRGDSLANDALAGRDGLVLADLSKHPQYRRRAYISGPPHLRFYAGCPVLSPDGHRVAVLSIFDTRPRTFRRSHHMLLQQLADRAGRIMFEHHPHAAGPDERTG
ncbi:hypothetical protein BH11ACT4_BH11ACT4_01260 [soil metagenome]